VFGVPPNVATCSANSPDWTSYRKVPGVRADFVHDSCDSCTPRCCFVIPEVVNGGWTGWSSCSVSCGSGLQTRSCSNPPASGGGAECQGASSQSCSMPACGSGDPAPGTLQFTRLRTWSKSRLGAHCRIRLVVWSQGRHWSWSLYRCCRCRSCCGLDLETSAGCQAEGDFDCGWVSKCGVRRSVRVQCRDHGFARTVARPRNSLGKSHFMLQITPHHV
jgi:hypothetical protein